MSADVKPTRAELRLLKRRLAMVKRGHKLLKRKQESLMLELFRALERFRAQERLTAEAGDRARRACTRAEMVSGRHAAWGFAMTREGATAAEMGERMFMGVRLPSYRPACVLKTQRLLPGEAPQNVEASQVCEEYVGNIIALAEAEGCLDALINEIKRTKRRVNALELKMIPRLESQSAFIVSRLEELEREALFSLKRIRSKLAGR